LGPKGRLLCIDQDRDALEFARARLAPFGRRASFAHGNFRELAELAAAEGFEDVDGILMDLGISSMQVDRAERGFAFGQKARDMRMDPSRAGHRRRDCEHGDEADLADVIWRYGKSGNRVASPASSSSRVRWRPRGS
jgi:16S rRNA (cytosine1402-N4)-methyltransferase